MLDLLIIDDNEMEHLILQKILDKFQLFPDASHSCDAKMIIELMEDCPGVPYKLPDVIFLDLNMPEFSGWDFLKNLERLYPVLKKSIDVFIVTSSVAADDRLLGDKYSFIKGFICKPVKIETLQNLHSLYHKQQAS